MADLVLRKAERADADAICALLRRSFPDNPKGGRDVLDWQYWDNPFGAPTVWVWEDGDRVVGSYAVVPYPAKVQGRRGRLGIGIDAAIDPDYQGRQLFGPLTSTLYADAYADGVSAIVCYPNDNSVRGIARQGWHEVGRLRSHLLPLRPEWYARRLRVPAPLLAPVVAAVSRRTVGGRHGHVSAEVGELGDEPDQLWAAVEHETHSGVVRDASWLRWRYRDRPGPSPYRSFVARRDGQLRALAVTTEREQRGGRFTYLLELLAVDDSAARAVVGAAAAAADGSAGVLVATLPGTPLARRARAAGLRPVPERLEEKQLHFGVVSDDPGLHTGWSLGWGDLDHL